MKLLHFNVPLGASSSFFNFYQRILPLVLKELASSDATNRRNAAFCAGEICKNGGAASLKYILLFSNSYSYISCLMPAALVSCTTC
jgi:hypothetical protein